MCALASNLISSNKEVSRNLGVHWIERRRQTCCPVFAARKLQIFTVSDETPDAELEANVNWDEAVVAGELTDARAYLPRDSGHHRQTTS